MPKQNTPKVMRKAVVEDTLLMKVVQKYFKLAGAVSVVWLVGYFKFSVSWLWLLLVVYVWKERSTKAKQHKTAISQEIARDEKSVILARVEDLPSWVNFPDVERAEWMNKILDQMWPYIGEFVEKIMRESVEPSVKNSLPASFKSFKFSTIDLGDIPPRIGGVKVYTQLRRDEIYMDLEINYSSDCNIAVSIKGVNAGIKDLRLHGTLRVVFKPLINKSPLIGGMLVFFLNNPELDFNLTSLANAFDLPGLSDMLHSIIQEQIANFMVLPNRYPIKLAEGLDLNKLRYPQPQGVVRVKVLEAKDLIKADISLTGKGKSDPYVVLKVGAKEVKTRIINNTVQPVWNETFEMIVDSADGQLLYIDVFDDDPGSKDDELGRVNMELSQLKEVGFEDEWLPLEDVKQGMIHIQLTWLWLANDPLELDRVMEQVMQDNRSDKTLEENKTHVAMLLVFLDSAMNLPRGKKTLQEPSPQATLSVGQQEMESGVRPNTNEPRWEESFRFMLHNPNYQNLEVEIKDTKTKKLIGGTLVKLKELLVAEDMVMDQKFHIKTSEGDSYVNMRLALRVLTPTANPEWMDDDDILIEESTKKKEAGSSVDGVGGAGSAQAAGSSVDRSANATSPGADQPSGREAAGDKEASATESMESARGPPAQESGLRQRNVPKNEAGDFGLGRVQMTFRYSQQRERLVIVVHKCSSLQPVEGDSKNLADPYVRMYLLPDKSSSSKKKTKVVKDELNPVFDETFEYSVSETELARRTLEVTVKNEVGMFSSSKTFMGTLLLDLSTLDISRAVTNWFDLAPEHQVKSTSFESDV
ncbi:extended synaptotagmin-like protein 2 [Plakobranchus ocellatus]|uniref:Extended synaptotagmin-like protein 2 n=1 Tax=Plakobranchus ocellatus TaxID=259542 RepID=A0AAV3Z550_9GAST|nr:extended synaptotagmin-like protein 2 [Plakobranchus ocellatus]